MPRLRLLHFTCILLLLAGLARAQNVNLGEAEAQKCEEKIASVQRDVLGKYDDALGELQLTMQKTADLEGALAVRTERQRVKAEQTLSDRNFATEPKALRALQLQTVTKLQELTTQLVQETLPKLIEYKRSLTVAGKLDEAVAVRTAIERLQNAHVPVVRPDANTVLAADTLLLAYAGDRARADKTYRNQKITVRGVVGGYRQDPADTKNFLVYLVGNTGGSWVQCSFSAAEYRFREDKNAIGALSLAITTKDGESTARVAKGQTVEIRGICEGLDEGVRLGKCDLPR